MKDSLLEDGPLVEGGQGRSGEDLETEAMALWCVGAFLGFVSLVAFTASAVWALFA